MPQCKKRVLLFVLCQVNPSRSFGKIVWFRDYVKDWGRFPTMRAVSMTIYCAALLIIYYLCFADLLIFKEVTSLSFLSARESEGCYSGGWTVFACILKLRGLCG